MQLNRFGQILAPVKDIVPLHHKIERISIRNKNPVHSLLLIAFIIGAVAVVFTFLSPLGSSIEYPFRSMWDTTRTSGGSSASNQIKFPLELGGTYDFAVNWGDGTNDIIKSWNQVE